VSDARVCDDHLRLLADTTNIEQTANGGKPVALDSRDPRTLRLYDLGPEDAIVVTCLCGWITEYGEGMLQRQHRVPSDTLVFDLQYRLRCRNCGRRKGFAIAVQDRRMIGTSSHRPPPIVIVAPRG